MLSVLTRLLAYAWCDKAIFSLSCSLMVVLAMVEMLLPWLTMHFIDQHVSQDNWQLNSLLLLLGLYLGLNLLSAVITYFQATTFFKLAAKVIATLRKDCFNHSLTLPMAHFIHQQKGEMVNRLTQDVEATRSLFSQLLGRMLKDTVTVIAVLIAMFSLHWQLALISLAFVPVFVAIFALYRHYALPLQRQVKANSAKLNGFLNESLNQTGIMQVFHAQARFGGRLNALAAKNIALTKQNIRLEALLLRPLFEFLAIIMMAATVLSFHWLPTSELGLGLLFAFFAYLSRFFEPIINLMQNQGEMVQSVAAAERVFALLDERKESLGGEINGDAPFKQAPKIRFQNVSFAYDDQLNLDNINFTLAAGEHLALVGPSGSGKTTLAHLLKSNLQPDQGEIFIDEIALSQMQRPSVRRNIALVEQHPFILSASVRENLCMGQTLSDKTILQQLQQVGLTPWLASLPQGLDTLIDQRSDSLSTGTRQLLAIARALCQDNRVIILDEASASLDPQANAALQHCLQQLKGQVTLVLIAHKIETLTGADHILVLVNGKKVQWGSHQQLAGETGVYQNLLQRTGHQQHAA